MEPTNPNIRWPQRFSVFKTISREFVGVYPTADVLSMASDSIKRRGIETAGVGKPVSVSRYFYAVRME